MLRNFLKESLRRLWRGPASSHWIIGALMFCLPLTLILFLGSLMATSRIKGTFESSNGIPEVTRFTELETLAPGTVVMLRGRISHVSCQLSPCPNDSKVSDLIIYRARPAEGRAVRFREEFGQTFPEFVLDVSGGRVVISPSQTHQHVIRDELHSVTYGNRELIGFRPGDTVTVQGQWQPEPYTAPVLIEVTGITSHDKQRLLQEWQDAFNKLRWLRHISGLLTGLGIVGLLMHMRRRRAYNHTKEKELWSLRDTTTEAPTT
jgi:hypothetical protein